MTFGVIRSREGAEVTFQTLGFSMRPDGSRPKPDSRIWSERKP
jgi:hypothetical protein